MGIDLQLLVTDLRAYRIRAGLTQSELGTLAGVSVRTVRAIEQGHVRNPRQASLRQLARVVDGAPVRTGSVIGVLGPLTVRQAGRPVELGPLKLRTLLGLLALHPNRIVPKSVITDVLWPDNPPPTHRQLLHTYISRLRRVTGHRIETVAGSGYTLRLDPGQLDLLRFEELARLSRWEEALVCWRGPVLADLPETVRATATAMAVTQRRLTVALALADEAIAAGKTAAAIGPLRELAAAEPLHEGLHARLMLALAIAGQQGDALTLHTEIRARLAEELGVEPGPELGAAHLRVLRQEVHAAAEDSAPHQLPAAPGSFIGRRDQLARLGRGRVSAICGAGGVGKTWLALRWAHDNLHRFPDGQLHVNLRGFDPVEPPLAPETAVRGFLESLGVTSAEMPTTAQAQLALYRSLLARKKMLVLLDNARDTAQVAPLLPANDGCTVLVTSRRQLPGLVSAHDATVVALDVLGEQESCELLGQHFTAAQLTGQPQDVLDVLRWCAGLPLALSIVAARVATEPDCSPAEIAHSLRTAAARLDALDAGEMSVDLRVVFKVSYQALPPPVARLFRLLGVAPGPDIGVTAAASLAGVPPADAAALLAALETANLARQHLPGRFRMHDLTKLYAAELAAAGEKQAAGHRVVQFYLRSALATDRVLFPHRPPFALPELPPGCVPQTHADAAAAMAWFSAEYDCLIAAQRLEGATSWQLAKAMRVYLWRRGRIHDTVEVWRSALAEAVRLADPTETMSAHRSLGDSYASVADFTAAQHHLDRAVVLARRLGNRMEEAHAHSSLAWQYDQHNDHRRALDHACRALDLYREVAGAQWQADMLNCVGWCHIKLGNYELAQEHCSAALAISQRHQHTDGAVHSLKSLGYLAVRTGRLADAARHYTEALTLCRRLDHPYTEASLLAQLGDTEHARGRQRDANSAWQQALELYRSQRRTAAARRMAERLATAATASREQRRP
ncbi:BTAD domain-containing putative transcriptional regulator [Crossiella sp. NPDC003009]